MTNPRSTMKNLFGKIQRNANQAAAAAKGVNQAAMSAEKRAEKLMQVHAMPGSRKLPTGGKRRAGRKSRKAGRKSKSTRRR